MSVKALSLATVTFLGPVTGASAAVINSPALFGGPTQSQATCYFTNASSVMVPLPQIIIRDENGVAQPIAANTCTGGSVQPQHTCSITVNISNALARYCFISVTTSGVAEGSLEIKDNDGNRLIEEPLTCSLGSC